MKRILHSDWLLKQLEKCLFWPDDKSFIGQDGLIFLRF